MPSCTLFFVFCFFEIRYNKVIACPLTRTHRRNAMNITKTKNRDIEKTYSTVQFVKKLRRLADCLEKNRPFDMQIAGERIYVPQNAVFNIEHEREKNQEEIEFQIKWKNKT